MQQGQNAYSQFLKGRGQCDTCCFLDELSPVRIDKETRRRQRGLNIGRLEEGSINW